MYSVPIRKVFPDSFSLFVLFPPVAKKSATRNHRPPKVQMVFHALGDARRPWMAAVANESLATQVSGMVGVVVHVDSSNGGGQFPSAGPDRSRS